MIKIAKYAALVVALAASPTVSAQTLFTTPGTHVFSGSLDLSKNLPTSTCVVSLNFNVGTGTPGGAATVSGAAVSGGGTGCGFISFSPTPYTVTHYGTGANTLLEILGVRVNIADIPGYAGADACEGSLFVDLSASGAGSALTFSTPLSDIPDANPDGGLNSTENPCQIEGTLTSSTRVTAV